MGTAERRLEMMRLLCVRRRATMKELAAEFGVSLRTIQRDIEELTFLIPIETKQGRYGGGIELMEGYSFDRQYMSGEEINLLCKVKKIASEGSRLILQKEEMSILDKIINSYQKKI